jgi:transketolase
MTIVAPADADEMRRFMPLTVDYQGPIYIRLGKGGDPIVSNDNVPFQIGKALPMRQGRDALIVTTGITLKVALDATSALAKRGIEAAVLHMATVKPLDVEALLEYVEPVPAIVTVEEHTVIGGLGSAVAEVIAESNFETAKRFKRLGIPDMFAEHYGSQNSLMAGFGITAENTAATVLELLEVPAKA